MALTRLKSEVARATVRCVGSFETGELATAAWAFASLGAPKPSTPGTPPEGLLDEEVRTASECRKAVVACGLAAASRANDLAPQELTGIACAVARAILPTGQGGDPQAPPKTLEALEALGEAALCQIDDFSAADAANFVWALAAAGARERPLLRAMGSHLERRVQELQPKALANVAWAFAASSVKEEGLMRALAREAAPRLPEFDAQALANTAWAFAGLRVREGALLEKIAEEAAGREPALLPETMNQINQAAEEAAKPSRPKGRSKRRGP